MCPRYGHFGPDEGLEDVEYTNVPVAGTAKRDTHCRQKGCRQKVPPKGTPTRDRQRTPTGNGVDVARLAFVQNWRKVATQSSVRLREIEQP